MKVYVIKSKQTKEYQTVVIDFIPDIRQADIFIDYEVALAYCPSDCEVVECELMEKTELSDYAKQVRKEVLDEICVDYAKRLSAFIGVKISISTAMEKLKEVLDQIQGETK